MARGANQVYDVRHDTSRGPDPGDVTRLNTRR